MTAEQIAGLGSAFASYLSSFRNCFVTRNTFKHLQEYCHGLLGDLPRKSVEPIALASGCAVRTLQEFLTQHVWDHQAMRDQIQRRIVAEHLPAPGESPADDLGAIGLIDETSTAKKGDKTPGVQRQHCGASGKIDNCIVSVHLALRYGPLLTMLDSELFLPEHTWDKDRDRCNEAHIPASVVYRSKWKIALEQIERALGNGVRFDWLTFDEWYGGKPDFLLALDKLGLTWIGEVPANFMCWPTLPKYHSAQAPFAAKRVDNTAIWGKPFLKQPWQTVQLQRQTLGPQTWRVKTAQVWMQQAHQPSARTYWLIVAENTETHEIKYFLSSAPPQTDLKKLLRVAFSRWGIEHIFRIAKSEIGFSHFEGRSYQGLIRHMILCQVVMLFVAEQTTRLRGEKSRPDHGADGPRLEHPVPPVAAAPLSARS
jgi:SRSO17 transposase